LLSDLSGSYKKFIRQEIAPIKGNNDNHRKCELGAGDMIKREKVYRQNSSEEHFSLANFPQSLIKN